jgi:hypothetical protein
MFFLKVKVGLWATNEHMGQAAVTALTGHRRLGCSGMA